jgi:hypothetical protein
MHIFNPVRREGVRKADVLLTATYRQRYAKTRYKLIIKILPHACVRVVKESGQQSVDHNTVHLKAPYPKKKKKNQQLVAH